MELSFPLFNSNELAEQYRPMFIFDKYEKYYPCSIEYLVKNSQLYKDKELVADFGNTTIEMLSNNSGNQLKYSKEIYNGDIEQAPVYFSINVSENFIDIIYILFFAYNGPLNLFNIIPVGEHAGDIEHIVLRLNRQTLEPNSIYFSAHNDEGQWVSWKNINTITAENKTHPMVYVARNSHAMYSSCGTHYRIFGLVNDHIVINKGTMLYDLVEIRDTNKYTTNEQKYDNDNWINYKGKWEDCDSLINRSWWNITEEYSSTILTRLFPWYYLYVKLRNKHKFN